MESNELDVSCALFLRGRAILARSLIPLHGVFILTYPAHHLTLRRCRSSMSYGTRINAKITLLLVHVAYEDEHHHVAPCHWNPAVVHYIKKGHILQTVRCTLISPTDSIASLTYNGAPFWKQRIKALTRLPSHTHSRPRPLWNA